MKLNRLELIALLGLIYIVGGCDSSGGSPPQTKKGFGFMKSDGPSGGQAANSEPTTNMETATDPVEDSFTIKMPAGWSNVAYRARRDNVSNAVAVSQSPDGATVLFAGDAAMPMFFDPSFEAINVTREAAKVNPLVQIAPYATADTFLPKYVQKKFGDLPGFQVLSSEPYPEFVAWMRQKLTDEGFAQAEATANLMRFKYDQDGKPMNVLIVGTVIGLHNTVWTPNLAGISTPGDPERYLPMLLTMVKSFEPKQAWRDKERAEHERRMAQIAEMGRRGMANLQASASAHQQRMDAIRAMGDASTKFYNDRMAAMDNNHRGFINYIRDENTVGNSSGGTSQVARGYTKYFMHKTNGSYIGGDSTMSLDSLRSMGLDPSDYYEAPVMR